jgi:hypothetical protein
VAVAVLRESESLRLRVHKPAQAAQDIISLLMVTPMQEVVEAVLAMAVLLVLEVLEVAEPGH